MNHLHSSGSMPLTEPRSGCSPLPCPLDMTAVSGRIAQLRMQLADLEADMIAACEAAAMRAQSIRQASATRDRWNRTTWRRYLMAVLRIEADFGSSMRHLRREIARLERQTAIPQVA